MFIGALVASPASFAADRSGETKAERNLIKEGNALFGEGKFHEALERYERALTLNAESTVALYNKAVTLVQLASDDNKGTEKDPRVAAAQIFQDIARADQSADLVAKSFYNLGNMAFNDEKYDLAIEMYKGSLRKIPENRKARQNLLLAMQKKQEQEQNQNQQQDQQQQQEQQQQQQQQEQQQQDQQQEQQQEQQMTQNAEQILQTMQNKENATRRKVNQREARPGGRPQTDKPW